MSAEFAEKMRLILGPEWCAMDDMHVVCDLAACWKSESHASQEKCVLDPSPAVAYALAEKVGVSWVEAIAPYVGWTRWTAYARKGVRRVQGLGSTRAEAECRALVALWEKINEQA